MFIGGMPIVLDRSTLKHACHIVCGTPGRILQLIESGAMSLKTSI